MKLEGRHLFYYECREREGMSEASKFLHLTVRHLTAGFYFTCGIRGEATCEE